MLPSERIRELEIQIHNQQPHLDRVVVCLRAITTYMDLEYESRAIEQAFSPPSVTQTEEGNVPRLPPIVFPTLPLKPEDKK